MKLYLFTLLILAGIFGGCKTTAPENTNSKNTTLSSTQNTNSQPKQSVPKTLPSDTPKEVLDYLASIRKLEQEGRDLQPLWADTAAPKFKEAAELAKKYNPEADALDPKSRQLDVDYTIFNFYLPLVQAKSCLSVMSARDKSCDKTEEEVSKIEDKIIANRTSDGRFSTVKK